MIKKLIITIIVFFVKTFSSLTKFKLNSYFINEYILKLDLNESKKYNNTVYKGPFKGLKIDNYHKRKLNILLGNFEYDVQRLLYNFAEEKKYSTFINIGGADGFYAVGMLKTGFFKNVIVFETLEKYRKRIKKNLERNNLKGLNIKGHCDSESLNLILDSNPSSLILCDIEGGEFSLFTDKILKKLSKSTLIIEIHMFNKKSSVEYSNLKNRLNKTHFISEVKQKYVQADIDSLSHLRDLEILMLLNENRRIRGLWLVAEPKQ